MPGRRRGRHRHARALFSVAPMFAPASEHPNLIVLPAQDVVLWIDGDGVPHSGFRRADFADQDAYFDLR